LRAKKQRVSVARLLGEPEIEPTRTVFTLGIDTPEAMGRAAREYASRFSMIKVKLGDFGHDLDRIRAVRDNAPTTRLIIDVNEAWTIDNLVDALPTLAACGVELVEQPLPAGRDQDLANIKRIVPIGADESVFVTADLAGLAGRYDAINIKLDKSGGLTEAMRMVTAANRLGLKIMVGCMLATSLGIAPSMIVARHCRFIDLDAPLMLSADRPHRLHYADDLVSPPAPALWG
jgi:L-alanine-DL-glutamate epimerase-like enolase superfamily enzyme